MEQSRILGHEMNRLLFLALIVSLPAAAGEIDPALCRDVNSADQDVVPKVMFKWLKFPHGVQLCPTYAPSGRFLWWLATIRLDMLGDHEFDDRDLHPKAPNGFGVVGYPRPRIVDATGRELGIISEAFPTPVPGRTRINLTDWKNDFPWRIAIRVVDVPPEGNYDAPSLLWDQRAQKYVQVGRSIYDNDP
jgi:hypothetical protein